MSNDTRPPYDWGSVVIWTLTLFLWGLATARLRHGSGMDNLAIGLMAGIMQAVVVGLIVAVSKYFIRSPKPDSNDALVSSKANDRVIFIGALVLATIIIGKAIYFGRYTSLFDAAFLAGVGFGVKNGRDFARWLLAAYAFISPFIVVVSVFNAVIWPVVFYAACQSIKAYRYVVRASDMDNKSIPSSARNTTSLQQSFSDSTKVAPIPSAQHAMLKVPANRAEVPLTDAKPNMNDQPQVNAMPSIAIESIQQSMQEIEHRMYEQIAQELENNTVDKAIWTKAYSQSGGDDKQTRVAYIKARFETLIAPEKAKLETMQREREEAARHKREPRIYLG